jgi:hypothetical protein
MRVMPAMAVGIPMTIPLKVASPPRCSEYRLEDETMMKKDIYQQGLAHT